MYGDLPVYGSFYNSTINIDFWGEHFKSNDTGGIDMQVLCFTASDFGVWAPFSCHPRMARRGDCQYAWLDCGWSDCALGHNHNQV